MSTNLRRLAGLVLAAATTATLGTLTAVGGLTAMSGAAASGNNCGIMTVKGHEYTVYATNVKCSVAKKWVPMIAAKKVPKNQLVHLKGPKGYSCIGYAGTEGGGVQGSGHCEKGFGGTGPYFNWVVSTASSS